MISVIIPTHQPKYLGKTLASLKSQAYVDFDYEVIVCENPKITEEVTSIISNYNCLNIKHVSSDIGANNARNTGIAKSSGEIIALIDDDCIADQNWLKEIHNTFLNRKISCVGGRVELSQNIKLTELQAIYLSKVSWGNTLFYRELYKDEHLVSANLAFTREAYDKVGGFNTNLGYKGKLNFIPNDEVLFIRDCALYGKVVYNDNLIVKHLIDDRMNLEFFLKRAYGQGYANVLLDREQEIYTFTLKEDFSFNEYNAIDLKLHSAKILGMNHALNNIVPTQEIYDKLKDLLDV